MAFSSYGAVHRSTVTGTRGMVASAHPLATLAGVRMLDVFTLEAVLGAPPEVPPNVVPHEVLGNPWVASYTWPQESYQVVGSLSEAEAMVSVYRLACS